MILEYVIIGNKPWYTLKELQEMHYTIDIQYDSLPINIAKLHEKDLIQPWWKQELIDLRLDHFLMN